MGLNIKLIKSGVTMRSRYSNIRRQPRMDIEYLLSRDSDFSQWLRDSLAYVRKELKELEDETRYAKSSD